MKITQSTLPGSTNSKRDNCVDEYGIQHLGIMCLILEASLKGQGKMKKVEAIKYIGTGVLSVGAGKW